MRRSRDNDEYKRDPDLLKGVEKIDYKEIIRAHRLKSSVRAQEHKTILAIQDTSYMVYTDHPATKGLGEISVKEGKNVKLVIVDSLTAHFRAEFVGRGTLADRQQKLNKYLHNLMKMAEQFNLAVYVTNQVMSNPAMMFGDPTTAIGGNIVGHASTFRIYIRRGKKGSRVAKLIDSPNLPDNECVFFVGAAGVTDED